MNDLCYVVDSFAFIVERGFRKCFSLFVVSCYYNCGWLFDVAWQVFGLGIAVGTDMIDGHLVFLRVDDFGGGLD